MSILTKNKKFFSAETRRKLSLAHLGKPSNHKGKKQSEAAKEKLRVYATGRWKGEKSPLWKGGVTPAHNQIRNSEEYQAWRVAVYKRDGFKCQHCKKPDLRLNAHHLKSFSEYPDLRFNVDNGITLCEQCHKKVHAKCQS